MRKWLKGSVAAAAALVLVGIGTAAHAAPTPENGPAAGGTEVTVEAPIGAYAGVSAGYFSTLAFTEDGTLFSWGSNVAGQLGDGTLEDRAEAVAVQLPEGVGATAVSMGLNHALAIGDDGNVYAWGDNGFGELGTGTASDEPVTTPVAVALPEGVTFTEISAMAGYSAAIGSDGLVYTWGANTSGQLGDGTFDDRALPEAVATPEGVTFSGLRALGDHIVVLGSDGVLYAWGANESGELGDGTTVTDGLPHPVRGLEDITVAQVQSGREFSAALTDDGRVFAWGDGSYGQLGDDALTSSGVPVEIPLPDGVLFTEISVGGEYVLALGDDGNTYAWGRGLEGALGNGVLANSATPVLVQLPEGTTFAQLSGGGAHAAGITADGDLLMWGSQVFGALGDGVLGEIGDFNPIPAPVITEVVVTAVEFDGIPGTDLVVNEDGTVTVVTPAHEAGPVDVSVQWTFNGVAQEPVVYPGGFVYLAAPTITDPADQTVAEGEDAVFAVEVTGDPAPTVAWEISLDGETWVPVEGTEGITVSEDGLSITVTGLPELDGAQFRATASSEAGLVTSAAATLTVEAEEPVDPVDPVDPEEPGEEPGEEVVPPAENGDGAADEGDLATTGSNGLTGVLLGAGALLALGAAGIAAARRGSNA